MDFKDLVLKRQSVRKYSKKPVEESKILQCLEAARLAPSACNSQPWTFVVVNEPALVEKVAKETYGALLSFNKFVKEAPVIIAIVMEKANFTSKAGTAIKKINYPLIDIGIAAEHFCLQATELGLGTCMIGWFNEKEIKDLLYIPEKQNISLLITLGYEPDNYKQRLKIRKPMEKMVSFNKY